MIGTTVSHYKILEKLDEGGMGVVYKAQDTKLNRTIALKFLHAHLIENESNRKRFMVEAQAASALDHPNICTIHEINETSDGKLYICMGFYEGEALRRKIKKGPIPFDDAMHIFFQIAQGLKTAHEKNIVHRDIKPGNIIITDNGEVKIVDFGLAKLAGVDLTKSTTSKGTAAYLSPEQIRQNKTDHRCDIWALGVLLFEMLTGRLPFDGDYPEPMMYSIVNQEPKSLSDYLDNVPESIQMIVNKLLQKDPQQRYQNISDLLYDLKPFTRGKDLSFIKSKQNLAEFFHWKKALLVALIVLSTAVLFLFIIKPNWFHGQSNRNSIAVLPLENIIDDIEQGWFTDGMTDALITELAQISGLRVISRSSVMAYKGTNKPPPQIASELGVRYLVDGSVVKAENLVKISARLINAYEDEYIWARDYERDFINILGLQGEIAAAIAGQVEVRLTPQEVKRLVSRRPVNPETYEMYMKGMYHLNKLTPEGVHKGLAYLQQAVQNNPDEPLAHAGLAIAYFTVAHGSSYSMDVISRIRTATMKALELDEYLAEAHLALAMVKVFGDLDWKSAVQSNEFALQLNPNSAMAHYFYSYLLRIRGPKQESYKEMITARQLDPLNPIFASDLGWIYYGDNKLDESIKESLNSLELNPNFPQAYCILGHAYAAKGMYEEAIAENRKAGELSFDWKWGLAHTLALAGHSDEALEIAAELEQRALPFDTWCLAAVYAGLGDGDKVFYWLEQAYKQHHPWILWIGTGQNFYFKAFTEDARFKDLTQRMNLPD